MSEQIEKEAVKEAEKQKMEPPKMWNVVMHNDDFTPIDFVVACLMYVFNKTQSQAEQIAQDIHTKGKGIVGRYTYEMAETKKTMAVMFARQQQHPLLIEMEQN